MQIKSWSSPALQRHSHVLPPYAWLALFSSHTTGKRSSSLVCKYIDHCDHNSVLQVELCKPSNHMQTNTKHAGIIFLYLVPPDNVFLPVLCAVCGRSDAGLPIIGQIRSQLQRESRLLRPVQCCYLAVALLSLLLFLLHPSTDRSHLAQIHPLSHHPLLIQLVLIFTWTKAFQLGSVFGL